MVARPVAVSGVRTRSPAAVWAEGTIEQPQATHYDGAMLRQLPRDILISVSFLVLAFAIAAASAWVVSKVIPGEQLCVCSGTELSAKYAPPNLIPAFAASANALC